MIRSASIVFAIIGLVACVDEPTTTTGSSDEPTSEAGRRLLDPTDHGSVVIGEGHGYQLVVDKAQDRVVATGATDSFVIDPAQPRSSLPQSKLQDSRDPFAAYGWQGWACRAACWTAAGAGCAAVGFTCAAGTVVTVGGFAIPCWVVTVAACGAAGGGASICGDWCTSQFG